MQIDDFTIVKLKDGSLTYIKEWMTRKDVEGKETVEVTGVYFVVQPSTILSLRNLIAFEDEKRTLIVSDIYGMKRIQSRSYEES
jgi:hypothetical protein